MGEDAVLQLRACRFSATEAEGGLPIRGQQPVDADVAAAGRAIVAVLLRGRRSEGRLFGDLARDFWRLAGDIGQEGIQQAQALFGVVITIEIELRVGGVVVALVEGAELGVGELRDDGRIAAGIVVVNRIREERALGRNDR